MKVIISGYGKMGHMVEAVLQRRGIELVCASEDICAIPKEVAKACVCIDFTTPDAFRANYRTLAENFKAVVVGTTGWNDIKAEVFDAFEKAGTPMIWGSNYSVGVIALFATILSGEVIREERINLRVRVTCADDEEGQPPREYYAMNEVAAARGAKGNIVDFDFSIAGDHIAHMRGDGLIVATATGSTAYALSAGGPLVGPTFTGMIVAPLAPHTLNARPIVAERNDIIEIDMPDDMQVGDVGLFIDGDTIELDSPIKNVTIMVGPDPTVILSCRKDSFYKQISRTFFDKK